ncbi:MAG TPA: metallophosphoesterase [Nocardioidaceae bacterium]|nr:metallophosphoesterase [Nocardioidaceae bacterium]
MRQVLDRERRGSRPQWRSLVLRSLMLLLAWLLIAIPVSFVIFTNSSKPTVLASHDAIVSPSLDGYATLDLGPYLPNLRYPTGTTLGAEIDLGKTNLSTYEALIERYAFIGSQPEGQIAKLRHTLTDLALDSVVSGGLIALAGPGLWVLLGRRRRDDLFRHVTPRRVAITGLATAVAAVAVVQPWDAGERAPEIVWQSIGAALQDVPIPEEAEAIEVQGGLMTSGTKRLAESAFDTYSSSLSFYNEVYEKAQELGPLLRQPEEDETVALLVSDRHDNIGMDKVARAIGDAGGATVLFDAGDDTSTGSEWESFSLESIAAAFEDYDYRYSIAGNHDSGDFVSDRMEELGFETPEGDVVDGPAGMRLLGVDDPRSSGLGTWRDTSGLSFSEHEHQVAELACEHDEEGDRINTLLVHDANTGREALSRGCVDLVIAGHLHVQLGPTRVVGENGKVGYTYTNGTTGGAAYALAIGSKLRRDAQVTLVTYRDGLPVGIQPVTVRTVGDFQVGEYVELDLGQDVLDIEEDLLDVDEDLLDVPADEQTGPGTENSPSPESP